MPVALTPHETWDFQLEDDRKDGKLDLSNTVWTLRAIPAWVDAQITDAIKLERTKDGGDVIHRNGGTIERLVLEHGVTGVRNWKDAEGREVTIKPRDLSWLDRLAPKHRIELGNAVYGRHKLTSEDSD